MLDESNVVRIFDAKWKRLEVAPSDVYQLAAYSSRYRCERVALVYPASVVCSAGLIEKYALAIPNAPYLEIYAVNVRALCFGGGLPLEMLPPRGEHETRSTLRVASRSYAHFQSAPVSLSESAQANGSGHSDILTY